jgi:hypothetical protein
VYVSILCPFVSPAIIVSNEVIKMVVDQTSDPGYATLFLASKQFPRLREMSKTAEFQSSEFEGLPDDAFAWPSKRKFPIHNREHTAISLAYRKYASAVPAEVDGMLEKAAEVHQIDRALFDNPVIEKTASQEHYLLPEQQRFKVASASDVLFAEGIVRRRYQELPVTDRAQALMNLEKVAQVFQVELSPSTLKLGHFTMTSTKILHDWVGARSEAARRRGMPTEGFDKLAALFQDVEPYVIDKRYQVKIAQVITELDKEAGLEEHYGKSLPDPTRTVWNTNKLSADQIDINGTMFDKALLAELPASFWGDVVGPDMAQAIAPSGIVDPEMLEQVIPTLPTDLKSVLVTQLAPYQQ